MKLKLITKALELLHLSNSNSRERTETMELGCCYFDILPKELKQVILSFLPDKVDVLHSRLVCKEWAQICSLNNTIVWKNFILPVRTIPDPQEHAKPVPRVCHTAVSHQDFMVVFGGHTGSTFSFGDILNDCWSLHIPTRTWHKLQGNFIHNTEHTAVVHDDKMYIFGGYYRNYLSDLYCYNFQERTYTLVEPSNDVRPKRRSACVAVIYNDCLYVYGGWDGVYGGNHNDMFYFNFATREWNPVKYESSFLPPPLRSVNGVVYKDALYLHGGFGSNHPEGLYKFDFETKQWSIVQATGPAPCGRSRSKLVGHKHKIYVLGGWDRTHYYQDYYEFNVLTSTWTKLDVKVNPIGQHSMIVYNDTLYVFGGFSELENKPVNHVFSHKLT